MKKIHNFVLKSFLGPFILTFFIALFILLLQFLWRYIDDLVGKGLTLGVLGELMFYTSASLVPMALPLAILLASIMSFGNMGEHLELLAMKASGISLWRIMMPLILFTVIISISGFFFSNNILPIANLKMRSLLYDIQQQRPELQIREGMFYNGITNYSIKVGEKDYKTNLLKQIVIYDHSHGKGNTSVTRADSGYMKITPDKRAMMISLFNGYNYIELEDDQSKRSYPFRRDKFARQDFAIDLQGFGLVRSDEGLFRNNFQMMNLEQLEYHEDSFRMERATSSKNLFKNLSTPNYYNKFSLVYNVDTTARNKSQRMISPDTIFMRLSSQNRLLAITTAITTARETQNYITSEFTVRDAEDKRISRCQIEWHKKFTLSVACFIFFLIGAPLGAIIRKGGFGMPIVISILFFIFYYIISMAGEKFVKENSISPFNGMWLSSILLLPVGIFLTFKATNDSAIMNKDFYINKLKKIPFIKKWVTKKKQHENSSPLQ